MLFALVRVLTIFCAVIALPWGFSPASAEIREGVAELKELRAVVEPIPDEFRKGGLSQSLILEAIAEQAKRNGINVITDPEDAKEGKERRLVVTVAGDCDQTRLCDLDLTFSFKAAEDILWTSSIDEPVVRSNVQRMLQLVRELFGQLLAEQRAH